MEVYTRPREIGELPLGAIIMLPMFILPLGGWMLEHGYTSFGTCGMKVAWGLPCLSCGATRGTLRLFHGDVLGALAFQPMMITLYFILLFWGVVSLWSLAKDKRVVIHLSNTEDIIFKILIVGLPALNWFYLYKMGI